MICGGVDRVQPILSMTHRKANRIVSRCVGIVVMHDDDRVPGAVVAFPGAHLLNVRDVRQRDHVFAAGDDPHETQIAVGQN